MKTFALTAAVLSSVILSTVTPATAGCSSHGCHRPFRYSYYPRYAPHYYRPAPPPVRPPLGPVGGLGPIGGPVGGSVGPMGNPGDETGLPAVNVPVGATITLPGNRGPEPGRVDLVLPQMKLPLAIGAWTTQGVSVTLPEMALTSALPAQIQVLVPGRRTPEMIGITLMPRPQVVLGGQLPQVIVEPQMQLMPSTASTNVAAPALGD